MAIDFRGPSGSVPTSQSKWVDRQAASSSPSARVHSGLDARSSPSPVTSSMDHQSSYFNIRFDTEPNLKSESVQSGSNRDASPSGFSYSHPTASISDLPTELLIQIFSYLTIDESPITVPSTSARGLGNSPESAVRALDGMERSAGAESERDQLRPGVRDIYVPTLDPSPHPTQAQIVRQTLASLSLVCKRFNQTVKPFLWDDVSLQNGRGWLSVVDALVEEVIVDETGKPVSVSRSGNQPQRSNNSLLTEAPRDLGVIEEQHQPQHQNQQPHALSDGPPTDQRFDSAIGSLAISQEGRMGGSSANSVSLPDHHPAELLSPAKSHLSLSPTSSLTHSVHQDSSAGHHRPQIIYKQPTPVMLPVDELTFSTAPPLVPLREGPEIEGLEEESDQTLVCTNDAWCRSQARGCCGPVAGPSQQPTGADGNRSGLNLYIPESTLNTAESSRHARSSSFTTGLGAGAGTGTGPSRMTVTIPAHQAQPYLPSLLTPPASRHPSPARYRSRSRSLSRSRSSRRNEVSPERPSGLRRATTLRRTATASSGDSAIDVEEEADESFSTQGILQRLDSISSNQGRSAFLQVEERGRSGRPLDAQQEILDYFGEDWRHGVLEIDEDVFEETYETPGPLIRHISFANFRTTGTRRTQEEAIRGKFVTGGRLEGVLKNAPNLRSLALTEYVDSSLTLPVLTEIFFRGYGRPDHPYCNDAPESMHSTEYVPYEPETDEEQWERRAEFSQIEALDFTGCVSRVFGESLEAFVQGWLMPPGHHDRTGPQSEARGRPGFVNHSPQEENEEMMENWTSDQSEWVRPQFTGLKRLSLRGCVTLSSSIIATLISCCPSLTHLDLSFTRVSPETLEILASRPDLRLEGLSLARSTRLTSESVRDFFMRAPCAETIIDFNLYGDPTYGSPLTQEDLEIMIRWSPAFQRGQLRYLDLSAAPLSASTLDAFAPQPALKSLGLSYVPLLPLQSVADFLRNRASNVEILTLTHSCSSELGIGLTSLAINMNLHSRLINPLCFPPFSVYGNSTEPAPTRLRVVELSQGVRKALANGARDWKIVKSKGGRGWYVDTTAGWVREFEAGGDGFKILYKRALARDHPWVRYLLQLSAADGKVSSGVGWHARKMEVVKGHGMMGREEGLYGAGSFAFEG